MARATARYSGIEAAVDAPKDESSQGSAAAELLKTVIPGGSLPA
jgi:hypothetical protein